MSKYWWMFVHNCIAHPLLFFTLNSKIAIRFHDYSSTMMRPCAMLRLQMRLRED